MELYVNGKQRSGEPVTAPHRDHRSPSTLHLGLSSLVLLLISLL